MYKLGASWFVATNVQKAICTVGHAPLNVQRALYTVRLAILDVQRGLCTVREGPKMVTPLIVLSQTVRA